MCLRIVYLLSLGSWIVLLDYEMLYPWLYWDNQGKVLTNRKFLLETLLDLECSWHSFIWIKPNWNAELSFNPHACLTIACFISNSWHQRIFWILKIIISQTNQKHHDNSLKLVIIIFYKFLFKPFNDVNFVTKNTKWGPKKLYMFTI